MINKLRRWAKRYTARYPEDPRITVLRTELASTAPSPGKGPAIAVQCMEDRFYFGLFGAICRELITRCGVSPELIVVRSINGAVGVGWQQWIARSALPTMLGTGQWVRSFGRLASDVAYRCVSFAHPIDDARDWFASRLIWRRERQRKEFAELCVLGVPVGDLLIDSYLRFRPAPRFDAADPFVARLIWQVHRDVRRARCYFRTRKPRLYLTSYSTYIEHGVTVRVALAERIKVWSFGSFQQFGKRLELDDWFHTADSRGYRRLFDLLDGQDARLAQANEQLSRRFAGGIDIATSYMRVSAYANPATVLPDVDGSVVVFLHDFYDSPHVYHDFVFTDFWDWACFTIDTLMNAGRKFHVKPHPNQISLSSEVMARLNEMYPQLPLLPANASSLQLATAGVACGVTAYGTVAHELAYFGVPTITCARHPHSAFDFCRTARTMDEYSGFLEAAGECTLDAAEMRRQALAFYYMHNLYGDPDELAFRADFVAFWKACHESDGDAQGLRDAFRAMQNAPGFRKLTERLL